MAFEPVSSQINLPELENKILEFWRENEVFQRSVTNRPSDKVWNFLDGPPFITGLPHYGTLLSSIPKDIFPRFQTMRGHRVRRVWGWDCHGLPAENKVENKLGIKRKKDIEEVVGVKKFIDECKLYVNEVSSEWEWYVDHIGRWVDFKNSYKTMDKDYMETVMWVFKQMYDLGHIYKGLRVSLYCPHCSTPISNFEVAMDPDNYKEITEPANVYKYKLQGQDAYLLAWSTTPWNKLATPALAVNPKLSYVKVLQDNQHYILAKTTLKILGDKPYEIREEFSGSDLVGQKFEPHYDFYSVEPGKKAFEVVGADFVTADEGTGVVTIAAYGEEDLNLMQKENIQIVLHVDDEGRIKPEVPQFGGMNYLDSNAAVNADLVQRGLMYREDAHTHTVPTCWRCHARLIYAPQDAWYVNIQQLKPRLEAANEPVNWFPGHFKHGRFLKSLQAAPDWCISRSRYWGSPVPVWECECGQRIVPGSIAELEQLSGAPVADLHKPEIDSVLIPCPKCGKNAHRVAEVLDSWIEAGSAAFAERHFPFEPGLSLEQFFPTDFIVEYTGQIRAWFYVLHVISTALYDSNAFKNVAVTGVILGTDGRKMSKNFGNYPDPKEMLSKYGGDALRLYLMGSPVMRGEDILISEDEYRNQIRGTLLIWWNVYNFFITYANIDGWTPQENSSSTPTHPLDQWITARLQDVTFKITGYLESFNTIDAISEAKQFIDDFSTWYIRRSRDRIGPSAPDADDKAAFYSTCYAVLTRLCQIMAPITPFISEAIFKNLTTQESVHLSDWPQAAAVDENQTQLVQDMKLVRKVVEMGLSVRKLQSIKVRQPLASLHVRSPQDQPGDRLIQLIKDELNVKAVEWGKGEDLGVEYDLTITPQLEAEGKNRELIRSVQEARKAAQARLDQWINLTVPVLPSTPQLQEELKRQTLARTLDAGSEIKVELL